MGEWTKEERELLVAGLELLEEGPLAELETHDGEDREEAEATLAQIRALIARLQG